MQSLLRDRGFDIAGVMESKEGSVIGFVSTEDLLGGEIGDHLNAINAEHLVSDAMLIGDLLKLLRAKNRAFVLIGSEVRGIVTLADLNKPPIRVYLFGLVSLLEMHLRFWVRAVYPENSWQKLLKDERLEAAQELLSVREKRDNQIDLLDCLQFCDKRDLLLVNEGARNMLGIQSKSKGEDFLCKAENLRNRLAHSQQDLVEGTTWPKLIDLVDEMEAVVHRSDEEVERKADSEKKDGPSLWLAN
jgi:hypothetical protein